jgi:large subunit ribosomal protein L21
VFVIVKVGEKQYTVKEGDIIEVPHLSRKQKSSVTIKEVLLASKAKKIDIGQPYLKGASVNCEVLGDVLGQKIYALKYKRRKGYRRKIGHRQKYTLLKVKEIRV